MFQKINISIADKIEASKSQSSDPNIASSTNSIPNNVDGSPGDSTVAKPDTNNINSAGPKITQQQADAQTKTNPSARSSSLPGDLKYENPQDAEFPDEQDPRTVTPTPKSKGFMESLIEAKAMDYMKSQTNTPEASNPEKGKEVPETNIAKAPDNKRVERPQTNTWSPGNINATDPGLPNQDLMDGTIDRRTQNPKYNGGPTFNPITYKSPKIAPFRMPKLK